MKRLIWFFVLLISRMAVGQDFEEVVYPDGHFAMPDARGVAVADFDNDGDQDFFVSSAISKLYLNEGDFVFSDVTIAAGMSGTRSVTAVWIDINDDGWLDLVTSSWQDARIFMNNGDGTFGAGSELPIKKRNHITAGDLNGDGWVDLFSSNFKNPSELLLNNGLDDFVDVAREGNVNINQNGMGGVLFDFDSDNDLDIYVTYDGDIPGQLFINNGEGIFTDRAQEAGLNLKSFGMGVDFGDFNRDGLLDFYVTNLYDNFLFIRQPDDTFVEMAVQAEVNDYGMGWGVRAVDFNNDGLTDIYINNEYDFSPYENRLYMNNGDLTFTDEADEDLANFESGFGAASGDFDNDGKLDLLVVNDNEDRAIRVFRNRSTAPNHWLQCHLVGTSTNKYAIGATVLAYHNNEVNIDMVTAGSSWASQSGNRLHFGLGGSMLVDSLFIQWPDGVLESFKNIDADQRLTIVQGEGLTRYNSEDFQAKAGRPTQLIYPNVIEAQLPDPDQSVARQWNELLLKSIRTDYARPTVHARNLFHLSAAMYDAWAAYGGNTFMLGKRFGGYEFEFAGVAIPDDLEAARNEAISYAAYRLLKYRFQNSPGAGVVLPLYDELMERLGYPTTYSGTMYQTGPPAALGNYIADEIIEFGLQDGSNEAGEYENTFYEPVNLPLRPEESGNAIMENPNRWQPLEFDVFIDQSGNVSSSIPDFLGAEWGNVTPFSLPGTDMEVKLRDEHPYQVYLDPGPPPLISDEGGLEDSYKWHHTMVAVWASHLDPSDGVMIDVSPNSMGNNPPFETTWDGMKSFYNYFEGGDRSRGYDLNPVTGMAYAEQWVPRADFARVLAEYWADGPDSETPPGHWFTILNYVNDHPALQRRFMGEGDLLPELEWDVKAYLTLGGAMHDAAVAAWSVKGYYDYVRPISAIRYMAEKGQSSDPSLPNYDPHGLPLIEGYVELVTPGDPLAGPGGEHVDEVKLYTWRGHQNYDDNFVAGVGWILARDWISYQRSTFVTPPFAGYVSGHSTFSRAAAEVLSRLTGDEYFPGGVGEFVARRNEFLVFERGPSVDVRLQWARYQDAADQSALSRIWGGIHPPADDLPGRKIGEIVGGYAFEKAASIFNGQVITSADSPVFDKQVVFPNPVVSGGIVNLINLTGSKLVRLRDISGKLIFEWSGSQQIEIPETKPGLYLLEVIGTESRTVHKLIIKQ